MRSRLTLLTLLLIGAVMLPATAGPAPAVSAPQFGRGTLYIVQDGKRIALSVEIANTTETRSHGLMFRPSLPENTGMLFVFDEDGKWGFWMKNTLIPLSIGFIDRSWRLLEVQDMEVAPDPQAGPFKIYEPAQAYRHALEVNKGFFQRKGITPGARFELVIPK